MIPYRWLAIICTGGILVADRLTKTWALTNLAIPRAYTSWCTLLLTHNSGIAWSIATPSSSLGSLLLLSFITVAVSICMLSLISACIKNQPIAIALGFLTGGALSNLYDRFIYGAVTDFILLHYQTLSWPIFNIADLSICLGGALWWLAMVQS